MIACGSSSGDTVREASAGCSSACTRAASLCGIETPPQCATLCTRWGYADDVLDCVGRAASCDAAQRCAVDQAVDPSDTGTGRIGETDPTGCAPYLCVCNDGDQSSCGSVGNAEAPCVDPTESVCVPACRSHGGLTKIVPVTAMLCGG